MFKFLRFKKIIKWILIVPLVVALFAFLYLLLLLGQSENFNVSLLNASKITKPCPTLNLTNASFDQILESFQAPMLVKKAYPTALSLAPYSNPYTYELKATYTTAQGTPYIIVAQRPQFIAQNRNLQGYTLEPNKTVQFAGLMGAWLSGRGNTIISANAEDVTFTIYFSNLPDNVILEELASLSLNK